MNPIVNYRFIDCNKCTTLVGDVDNGKGYACMGAGGLCKIFVLHAQFCCESKTALRNKVYFLKKNNFQAVKLKSELGILSP